MKKILNRKEQSFQINISISKIRITNPVNLLSTCLQLQWKRGPQITQSELINNTPSAQGEINTNVQFSRVSKIRFDAKDKMKRKICEFKLFKVEMKGKPMLYCSRKIDMTQLQTNEFQMIDMDKGVSLEMSISLEAMNGK